MVASFTAAHRGGEGPPLVCLHGFMDTWRTWELVLPRLERRHDVLAPTLAGHAGGPPLPPGDATTIDTLADVVEAAMDAVGWDSAHLVGTSLGGFVALQLAARGRARSVVAFAPAGGWAAGDDTWRRTLMQQEQLHATMRAVAPRAATWLADPQRRRDATRLVTERSDHLPVELLVHQAIGVARCAAPELLAVARRDGYPLDAASVTCPVRLVWGTADRLLPWPGSARRFIHEWLPRADVVVLDGVGHYPQLDVPLEAAELILGWTSPGG
jgi:pimeloyl-ACP methyl ester carboxylesterase